ncbi:lysine histidine transporter 2 [Actinidia rufa]|uniref:Lysine histidine transporter 2 n=1 Tax=Actinidia rufa TaxID=165716 RepID=A0A7J0D6I6_9ERIC|nr:lysine histidine transporter 2 [Actinidia rufa]
MPPTYFPLRWESTGDQWWYVSPIDWAAANGHYDLWEMMNRAVHAAARGGNVEILREILEDSTDVLVYRDAQGSTVLHTASGRGRVEVVKYLLETYDIITSTDNKGNTALNVAAYRGCLAVLVCGKLVNTQDIINVRNNDGRTALHMAVLENIQSELVELLMSVPSINLNIRDIDGMTPLDLLKQRPRSASSDIVIKRLISAGGISNFQDYMARTALVSHLKMQGIGRSPGTSFRIPDAEIFLYTGIENAYDTEYGTYSSEISNVNSPAMSNSLENRKSSSVNNAARRLKILLRWPRKEKKTDSKLGADDSSESFLEDGPTPLRQIFTKKNCHFQTTKGFFLFCNNFSTSLGNILFQNQGGKMALNVSQVNEKSAEEKNIDEWLLITSFRNAKMVVFCFSQRHCHGWRQRPEPALCQFGAWMVMDHHASPVTGHHLVLAVANGSHPQNGSGYSPIAGVDSVKKEVLEHVDYTPRGKTRNV